MKDSWNGFILIKIVTYDIRSFMFSVKVRNLRFLAAFLYNGICVEVGIQKLMILVFSKD